MRVLVDADTIAFASAASAEDDDLWKATSRANEWVERILVACSATEYELWLSGSDNFRYRYYPEYKATRLGAYRPRWEKDVKDFLVDQWQANWSSGCEADDMVGVRQSDSTIIAHIDKDIDMIPGNHYNWELTRLGKVLRPETKYYISDTESYRRFYYQMLIGDTTDNIKGVVGIGKIKATELLSGIEDPYEMFNTVRQAYGNDEEMEMNAKVLWIWRKDNDIFNMEEWLNKTAIRKEQGKTLTEDGT